MTRALAQVDALGAGGRPRRRGHPGPDADRAIRAGPGAGRSWSGRLLWQPGMLSYLGRGGSSARHRHHAIQIAVSFDDPFELRLCDQQLTARAVLVPSDAPHAFDTGGRRIFYSLIEPHSSIGSALRRRAGELAGRDLSGLLGAEGEPAGDASAILDYSRRVAGALIPLAPPDPLTAPVLAALEYLDESLPRRPRLEEAARAGHLSPSRLTHLFSEQVGVPFRRFVLWLRLRRAAGCASAGATLAESAAAAGFSDQAHLTRTCRATFGVTPSVLGAMESLTASREHGDLVL